MKAACTYSIRRGTKTKPPFPTDYIWIDLYYHDENDIVCYIGETKYTTDLVGEQVALSGFKTVPGGNIARIPIRLVWHDGQADAISKVYTLLVSTIDYRPNISQQPASITVEKGETATLICEATGQDGTELHYQWYDQYNLPIKGAAGSTYTVPVSTLAGNTVYHCEITAEVDGVCYWTRSENATVTTRLSYITEPVILKELCSYTRTKTEIIDGSYRTEYNAGQHPDSMNIRVQLMEDGVNYSVDIYHNAKNSYDGAELVETTVGRQMDQSTSSRDFSRNVVPRYEAGEHYFFAVVTASDPAGLLEAKTVKSTIVKLTFSPVVLDLEGMGTADKPYLLKFYEDLVKIQDMVKAGNRLYGVYFKLANDITLPLEWEGIGYKPEGAQSDEVNAFGGILDGEFHTVTIAEGGLPLFQYTSDAIIRNLNIYGKQIAGAGLLNGAFIDYGDDNNYWTGCPSSITVENVTLLSGSSTQKSGLILGGGSGANTVTLRNCVIQEGCVIGYDKSQSAIGSFVGNFNGQLDNCVSYAAVYGVNGVGGLAGVKGQSMGLCVMRNCAFLGMVEASGDWVGGLFGQGYTSESAPNTMSFNYINCYVNATITGNDYIGGLFGGEGGLQASANDTYIRDGFFYGTINAAEGAQYVGGIIGFIYSVNETQEFENNYFYETSGTATEAIGNNVTFSSDEVTQARKAGMANAPQTAASFADGSVLELMNGGLYKNWVQEDGSLYPVIDSKPVPLHISISGDYQTDYFVGDSLDMTDAEFTVYYSDGSQKTILPSDTELVTSGFTSEEQGFYTVKCTYGPVYVTFPIRVLLPKPKTITASFVLYGDTVHDRSAGTHTLADSNLTEWIARSEYEIDENTTVLDVFTEAATKAGLTWVNESGNYISSITNGDVTLAEKDNGPNSGWMYTLNGVHPLNGVAEQFLSDGDCILFHYSDDYTVEGGMDSAAVQSMTITTAAPTVEVGEKTDALTVSFTPTLLNGNVRIDWSSSNTAIASVDKNGVITGIAEGEATITAKAGGKEATVKVTVIPGEVPTVPVESVTIAPESLSLKVGETGNLTATILPENATAQTVQWSSGDDTIATVDDNGVVTAVKAGSTTINATAGGKNTSITITVEAEVAPDDDPLTAAAKYLYDTVTAPTVGTTGGEWVILGLARSDYNVPDAYYQGYYERLCAVLEENNGILPKSVNSTGTVHTNTEYSRVIVALTAIGKDPTDVAGVNLLLPLEDFETTSGQGLNGSIYALIAMDAGQYDVSTREQYIADILSKQLPDGGWNDAGSGTADPDYTGMALQALAKYTDRAEVKTAVGKALEVMSQQQNENGGFNSSSTPTSESSAQMLVALCELGISLKDERFVKNGKTILDDLLTYQNADGSFRHISNGKANQMATEQALYALVAAYRVENDMTTLYRMTDPQSVDDNPEIIEVTSIELDQSKASISVGGSVKLTATVLPTDAADRTVTWSSSNEDVATVSDGAVTGKSAGEATITAKAGEFTATCIVTVTAASSGTEKKTITVTFTLLGDKAHNSDTDGQVHGLAMGGLETWIAAKTYILDKGATVKDLFELALTEAGMSWSNPSGNYVEDITFGGLTIGQLDNGVNSGWMYTLNGVHSSLGLAEQGLKDNDVVVWHYTDDYKQESGSEGWGDSGSGGSSGSSTETTVPENEENTITVSAEVTDGEAKAEVEAEAITEALENSEENTLTVKVDTEDAESVELILSAEAVKAAAEGEIDLHIETEQGTVKLDAGTLSELAESGAEIAVTVTAGEDGSFTLDVTADGETVDAKVKVELPAADESQVLVIVNEDGTEEVIKKSVVEDGKVYAELPAGATVKVMENEKDFEDVDEEAWYAEAVEFAASHELFQGVSETEFAPKDNMTRAMLVTVLFRLEDQPETAGETSFGDVTDGAWYADAVAWASETGLVNGTDKGFEPNENVSREQIATILYRYAKYVGMDTTAKGDVSKFGDAAEISPWAKDAMAWAVEVGLFQGDENGKLDPGGDATRGQVAALMQRLIGLIVK